MTSTGQVSEDLPTVYRLHAATGANDRDATFAYMLDNELVAVGWGSERLGSAPDWPTYEREAAAKYGKVSSAARAMHDALDGALVWMRDPQGTYYLARIEGDWRYLADAAAADVDLFNARPATIRPVGVESRVPGKVANSFIRGQAFRHIWDEAARRYTQSLWEELAGEPPSFRPSYAAVLRSLLGPQELEDLVAVYLQREQDYLVLPASRRPDTPAYEYVLRHPDGHEAVVQVKTGESAVPVGADALPVDHIDRVYVFSPNDRYTGTQAANVEKLDFEGLVGFMREQPDSLPPL
ncbi:MAG: hypothetical protein ABR521_02090, partial [Gaiellaceae bacterium]